MSEKKIKKKLVDFIEKCVENYIEEHLADLKRKLLNMDGFKSDEEYKNLQFQFEEVNDKNKDLQTDIENLRSENSGLKQKQKFLQREIENTDEKQEELEQKNRDLITDNEKIKAEKESAEKKLAECEKNLNKANNTIVDIKNEAGRIIDSMKQEIEEAHKQKKTLDYFTAGYGEIDSMYKIYQKLDENIHEELSGIFGSADTPIQFFCSALQENHLDNFWEYICSKINSGKINKNTEDMLNNLFDFCFDMVNISQTKPIYKRLQVQAGFDFDNNYMIKTSDSSQLGIIKEIKLEGYTYASSNKVVKRSLVQVESED
ncbi:hypothetical protein [Megamonas hypermegale]|uniref:hypothetical protein n=1 Tax=Megamonas hypermegale TaxID=158847 RepID=UPI0026F013F9|nr:hypothetical protein [Megamonas hypermegale]